MRSQYHQRSLDAFNRWTPLSRGEAFFLVQVEIAQNGKRWLHCIQDKTTSYPQALTIKLVPMLLPLMRWRREEICVSTVAMHSEGTTEIRSSRSVNAGGADEHLADSTRTNRLQMGTVCRRFPRTSEQASSFERKALRFQYLIGGRTCRAWT
ncbi:uncharacterized protein LOC144110913 [Amblyomma americanum]